jgi:hypothetical protein
LRRGASLEEINTEYAKTRKSRERKAVGKKQKAVGERLGAAGRKAEDGRPMFFVFCFSV